MKITWLISILCVLSSFAHAQQNTVADSLLQKLHSVSDTQKVHVLLSISNKYKFTDISRSITYGAQALNAAKKIDYKNGIAEALGRLAEYYSYSGDEEKGLRLMFQLLDFEKKRNNQSGEAFSLLNVANIYNRLGAYPEALAYYLKSLRLYENLKNTEKTAIALSDIGHLYDDQNDLTALHYYLQAGHLLRDQKEKHYSDLAMINTSIGFFYKDRGQPDSALEYFKKALLNSGRIPSEYNTHAITMALSNIGSVYESKKEFSEALAYNEKAFKIAQKTNNRVLLGLNFQNKARIYKNLSAFDKSIVYYKKSAEIFNELGMKDRLSASQNLLSENYYASKNFDSANYYASKALETANAGSLPNQAKDALQNLIKINEAKGLYKRALKFQQQFQGVSDTLLNKEKAKQLAGLRIIYETEKKQEQIELLNLQAEKEKILRYVLSGGIILLSLIGFLLYRQQRIKIKKNKQLFESQETLTTEQLKNAHLHETQLEQELGFKKKQLTTNALNLLQKNQLLEELKEKINQIRKETDGKISGKLNKLQRTIGYSFSLDKDWDEFRKYFEQVHDEFFKELTNRFPDLSNKELRLCALLKLNLTSKEIAAITGISPSSVKMARYRLRRKLELNAEEDLVAFFIHLEKTIPDRTGKYFIYYTSDSKTFPDTT